jgi:hypothetical protein
VRPALIAAHPEGEKVIAALGPWGRRALARLRELAGAELAELDAVLVGVVPNAESALDLCLRAELKSPWDAAQLERRFPDGRESAHGGQAFRTIGDRAVYLADGGRVLVNAPAALVPALVDAAGPPPLGRDLERLVEHSDAERAATVILQPKFLHASGHTLLAAEAAPLRDALQLLVANDATAVALSAHWDDNFFAELRAVPALNVPSRTLAVKLRQRVDAAPDQIEEQILAEPWSPYGRKILARFPAMLRKLAGYARHGDDDRLALVRAYLPPVAGHNLLMAAELLLTQPRASAAVAATPQAPATPPATLEERLARPTTLAFAKESLERALELLAADLGVEITIAGGDLQLDGITKNQSLGLELRDRPAGEILLEILLRANPDRTATGPADAKQKLVYVVEPAAGGRGRIIVTTRAAAEKRGDPLPGVFVGASP